MTRLYVYFLYTHDIKEILPSWGNLVRLSSCFAKINLNRLPTDWTFQNNFISKSWTISSFKTHNSWEKHTDQWLLVPKFVPAHKVYLIQKKINVTLKNWFKDEKYESWLQAHLSTYKYRESCVINRTCFFISSAFIVFTVSRVLSIGHVSS